jgi:hypothetical protein
MLTAIRRQKNGGLCGGGEHERFVHARPLTPKQLLVEEQPAFAAHGAAWEFNLRHSASR